MKAKGDKASYPSTNNPALILSEAYKKAAGLNTVQVGYKTSADFLNDMLSGRLDWVWYDPVTGLARIRDGKFRPLAISTGKRISSVPDIPTAKEAGLPDIAMSLWWVTAVPAGTPQPIVDKLNAWWTEIGKMQETRDFLAKNGGEPYAGTPAQTKALVDKEIADWKGYVALWIAYVTPAGTPDAIVAKLNHAMNEILKEPDIVENLKKHGFEPDAGSPQALSARISTETAKWRALVAKTGIKPE
jgi:tripartite-type tricarboxylate transporter receptor subunit TctC